jgi:hypothetical protein
MAFEFRAIDRKVPAGGKFNVTVKPVQVSATVYRLVNLQPGSLDNEAIIQYRIRYAPIDTFYLMVPAKLADADVEITGDNIKEKPRIDKLSAELLPASVDVNAASWAFYKVVLQSKVMGLYQLRLFSRSSFRAGEAGQAAIVDVQPILAAGRLADQNGYIAIAKADTLAIAEPNVSNLTPADATSAVDLPYEPHRRIAALAFKYDSPPFMLKLPVVTQKQASVFTTIVNGAIIEQVLARDGMLNTHATFLIATSQGDRLSVRLPEAAELTAVTLNGNETPVEAGASANERVIRLPPSAGQVSKYILEISYGLKGASAWGLVAPALPEQVPIQQTLWRLWIPEDYYLLGHRRIFSRLQPNQSQFMLGLLQQGQPGQLGFKLTGQGKAIDFVRQGPPDKLSVMLAGRELFNIAVWILTIAAGVLMLKLSGYRRVMIILAAGLIIGIIYLFLPLFVNQIILTGMFAGIIVLLLWAAQWGFVKLPALRRKPAAATSASLVTPQQTNNVQG